MMKKKQSHYGTADPRLRVTTDVDRTYHHLYGMCIGAYGGVFLGIILGALYGTTQISTAAPIFSQVSFIAMPFSYAIIYGSLFGFAGLFLGTLVDVMIFILTELLLNKKMESD